MLEGLFQPTHLLIIFAIALLVFGPKKLPQLGRGLGEAVRGFKSAVRGDDAQLASAESSRPDVTPAKE